LEGTLKWRREFGVYDMTAEHVEPEVRFSQTLQLALPLGLTSKMLCEKALTGKMVTFGYDTRRRPALYMIPSRQNTEESPRQIEFAIWMLERALDLTGPGVE
jgi:CRAL/TRIO domain